MIKRAPVISLTIGPPTTSAISAIPWHPRWLLRKSPWIMAAQVFRKPQPITLSVPTKQGQSVRNSSSEELELTANSTKVVHRCWNRKDAYSKDDLQEDDRCSWPFDGTKVDARRRFENLEFLIVVRIEDSASCCCGCLDIRLSIMLQLLLL